MEEIITITGKTAHRHSTIPDNLNIRANDIIAYICILHVCSVNLCDGIFLKPNKLISGIGDVLK